MVLENIGQLHRLFNKFGHWRFGIASHGCHFEASK
jgi:hypothetical protein